MQDLWRAHEDQVQRLWGDKDSEISLLRLPLWRHQALAEKNWLCLQTLPQQQHGAYRPNPQFKLLGIMAPSTVENTPPRPFHFKISQTCQILILLMLTFPTTLLLFSHDSRRFLSLQGQWVLWLDAEIYIRAHHLRSHYSEHARNTHKVHFWNTFKAPLSLPCKNRSKALAQRWDWEVISLPEDPSIPTGLPEHTSSTRTRIRLPTEVDADHHSAEEQSWTKIQEGCCCNNLFTKTICLESGKHKFPYFYLTTWNGWPEAEGFKETKHYLPFLKLSNCKEKKSWWHLIELGRKGVPECYLLVGTEDMGFSLCSWDCLTF